jgi:hypothetical protein
MRHKLYKCCRIVLVFKQLNMLFSTVGVLISWIWTPHKAHISPCLRCVCVPNISYRNRRGEVYKTFTLVAHKLKSQYLITVHFPKMSHASTLSVSCWDIINTRWTSSCWPQWLSASCAGRHFIHLLCVSSNFKQCEYFRTGLWLISRKKLQTEHILCLECSWHVRNAIWHDISQLKWPMNSRTKYPLNSTYRMFQRINIYLNKPRFRFVKTIWCNITHTCKHVILIMT